MIAEKNQNIRVSREENQNLPSQIEDSYPWYLCEYDVYKNRAEYIESYFTNPIITPSIYDKYEELKDTRLFAIIGSEDLLVDECVDLSNKWKGNLIS